MILKLMAETEGHSHILDTILSRLRSDWQRKYHIAPCPGGTFVERERFVGVCYRATILFGKGGSEKRVRSVRDGPGDAMIRRIITRFSAGL